MGYIVYITSGFNSVSDSYVKDVLERLNWVDKNTLERDLRPSIDCKIEIVLQRFKEAYKKCLNNEMKNIETILVLRRLKQTWNCKTFEVLQAQVECLLKSYFPGKYLGQVDSEDVKIFKGSIRESECDKMWALQDVPQQNIFHARSKFSTGDFFNPMLTINYYKFAQGLRLAKEKRISISPKIWGY